MPDIHTPREFIVWLADQKTVGVAELSPGPFIINIGQGDIDAAQLLNRLSPEIEEQTIGEVRDRLLNGVIHRLADIVDEADDNEEGMALAWQDRQVQALLTAWWWIVFWASQKTKA